MSDWSFAGVWRALAREAPDREAVVCGRRRLTFAELDERSRRLAWHLERAAGLEPGDKVAIDLLNRPEYLEAFFAASMLGCVPVNVNYRYVADEVRYVLENADAKAVVHQPQFAEAVAAAGTEMDDPPLKL